MITEKELAKIYNSEVFKENIEAKYSDLLNCIETKLRNKDSKMISRERSITVFIEKDKFPEMNLDSNKIADITDYYMREGNFDKVEYTHDGIKRIISFKFYLNDIQGEKIESDQFQLHY